MGDDDGVDADDLSLEVQQGAAAVSGIDGGVGLEEVLVAAGIEDPAPVLGADDPLGDGLVEPPRMADGHDPLTHFDLVRIAKGHVGEGAFRGDLDHGQVGPWGPIR